MTYLHCLIYSQKSIFQHSIVGTSSSPDLVPPLRTLSNCPLPMRWKNWSLRAPLPQHQRQKEHVTLMTDQALISEIQGKWVSAKQKSLGKACIYITPENSWTGAWWKFIFPEPALLRLCELSKLWLLEFSVVIGTLMGWDHKTRWLSYLRCGACGGKLTFFHQLYFFFFSSSKCKSLSSCDVSTQKLLLGTCASLQLESSEISST